MRVAAAAAAGAIASVRVGRLAPGTSEPYAADIASTRCCTYLLLAVCRLCVSVVPISRKHHLEIDYNLHSMHGSHLRFRLVSRKIAQVQEID